MAKKRSAKGQFVASSKKRRATRATPIAAPRRKRRRYRSNPDGPADLVGEGPTSNPPPMQDLVEFILPGFAGYAVTKGMARIVQTQLSKKYPNGGKHIAAGATIAAFAAAWLLLHRIKRLQKYHTPAVVGAGIASLQTLVKTYLPKFGWAVTDLPTADTMPNGGSQLLQDIAPKTLFPGGPEIVDDDEDLTDASSASLDDMDLGSLGGGTSDPSEYM